MAFGQTGKLPGTISRLFVQKEKSLRSFVRSAAGTISGGRGVRRPPSLPPFHYLQSTVLKGSPNFIRGGVPFQKRSPTHHWSRCFN